MEQAANNRAHGTTADPAELARFAATARQWWDPAGPYRALHRLNPVRLAYVRDHACRHFRRDPVATTPLVDLQIVDVGCGGGLLAEPLTRLGAHVTAIDATAETIAVAEGHSARAGLQISYRCATAEDLVAEAKHFDVVLTMEIVEHVADLNGFLTACSTLVRPGGLLFAATINRTTKAFLLAVVAGEWILRWLPRGTHDWNKFVRPDEMTRGLAAGGVHVTATTGVTYNPLADTWSLDPRDLAVNYMCVGEKGVGGDC